MTTPPAHAAQTVDVSRFDGHTSGPWKADGDAHSWTPEGYGGNWVETPTSDWYSTQAETGSEHAQQSVDAALIAAAPELLAAYIALRAEVDRLLPYVERAEKAEQRLRVSVSILDTAQADNARLRRLWDLVNLKFTSGNSVPVDHITIKRGELEDIVKHYTGNDDTGG